MKLAAIDQIASKREAISVIMEIGDIDRNVAIVQENDPAIGGGFAKSDLEQVGDLGVRYADRHRLVGMTDRDVLHLHDARQGR